VVVASSEVKVDPDEFVVPLSTSIARPLAS